MPLLLLLIVVAPLLEIYVIVQVSQAIGALWTLLALIGVSVLGVALVRREGPRAWTRFRQAVREGRTPTTEVVDGALLVLAGALLVVPGFLSGLVGLSLLVPVVRNAGGRMIRSRRRVVGVSGDGAQVFTHGGPGRGERRADDDVVEVEVIDVRRDSDPPLH